MAPESDGPTSGPKSGGKAGVPMVAVGLAVFAAFIVLMYVLG